MDHDPDGRLTCARTQDLLVARSLDPESEIDELALQHHLLDCATCQEYQHILGALAPALDIDNAPALPVDPYVFQDVLHELQARRRRHVLGFPLPAVRRTRPC